MNKLKIFKNKKIIITGHTGFKGSWLSLWLYFLGAEIYGISDEIKTKPSFFNEIKKIFKKTFIMDVYDYKEFKQKIKNIKPNFIFHLAGQSLVIDSYKDPLKTFKTNSMGTINLLTILKELNLKVVTIIITSDKVYDNKNKKVSFKEKDSLGTNDPYSASKSLAELSIESFNKSFFNKKSSNVRIGIARAGNVIGGGDWNKNRLIPDCMRFWSQKKIAKIRNKNSTRPWQHVLEPIYGYLVFALNLYKSSKHSGTALNFGPKKNQNFKVQDIMAMLSKNWQNSQYVYKKTFNFYESKLLRLNIEKAYKILNWRPVLKINEAIEMTVSWYKQYYFNKNKIIDFSKNQIKLYESHIKKN